MLHDFAPIPGPIPSLLNRSSPPGGATAGWVGMKPHGWPKTWGCPWWPALADGDWKWLGKPEHPNDLLFEVWDVLGGVRKMGKVLFNCQFFFLFTHSCSMFMMLAHLCHDPRSLWCFVASSTPRNGCRNVWRRGRQRNPQWEQMSKQRASWQLPVQSGWFV